MTRAISIFFLGGTISMAGRGAGVVSRLGAAELLDAVPGLSELDIQLDAHDFRRIPSASLTFADILELVGAAEYAAADGVVVVQGTDTIEETAYLIDLLWQAEAPVVVTGAMRNPTLAGADGPANLLAAVTVAADAACAGLGALVVLNDEIHAARHVSKRHSTSPAAFVSPNAGPLGRVVEGAAVLSAGVARRPAPALARPATVSARVPIVVTALDDDGALLDGLEERCDGLVVAGFGGGHVPGHWAERLGALAARIPVVLASRTGAGPVLTHTYGAPGSEVDLIGRGLVPARMLDAYKARVLLALLISSGADRATIAAAFA